MRYDEILSRSFRIVWRRKYLWLLALFSGEGFGASASGGGSGSSGVQYQPSATLPDVTWVPYWLQDRLGLIFGVLIGLAFLGFVLFLLGCFCTGALIRSQAELDAGAPFNFEQARRAGAQAFWRVLGLRLLVFVLLLLPLLVLAVILVLIAVNGRPLAAVLIALPFLFLYLAYLLAAGLVTILATRAAVLEELGPVASLRRAIRLLGQRFPRVIVTALLTAAVGIGIGIATSVVYGVLSIPFQASALTAPGDLGRVLAAYAALAAVVIPVSVLLGAPIGAYYSTVWTVAYRRFDAEPEAPPAPPLG